MTKHYILKLDPDAQYDWDRCTLRDPITADRPDLATLIASAVGEQAGSYLVAVEIQVNVLEQIPAAHGSAAAEAETPDRAILPPRVQLKELVA